MCVKKKNFNIIINKMKTKYFIKNKIKKGYININTKRKNKHLISKKFIIFFFPSLNIYTNIMIINQYVHNI